MATDGNASERSSPEPVPDAANPPCPEPTLTPTPKLTDGTVDALRARRSPVVNVVSVPPSPGRFVLKRPDFAVEHVE